MLNHYKTKLFFACIGLGFVWFFIYKLLHGNMSSSLLNPIVIYGFIISGALALKFILPGRGLENQGLESVNVEKNNFPFFLLVIGLFVLMASLVIVFLKSFLLSYGNFTREFGVFLGVLENIHHGLLPNIHFSFLYGIFPVYLSFIISKITGNFVIALFVSKILLDVFALFLIYYLLKILNKSWKWPLILIIISGLQLFMLSSGSLHASPLRYLSLLLPLILIIISLKNKFWYFNLFLLSPFVLFFISPETGLLSLCYVWAIVILFLIDNEKRRLILSQKLFPVFWIHLFIILSIFIYDPLKNFFYNSFVYAKGIINGIVVYDLPSFFEPLNLMIKNNFDGMTLFILNSLFYLYLIPLSVLSYYSLNILIRSIKNRSFSIDNIAILSLVFFSLAYFFKALGGAAIYGYQSLTIFFVIMAFCILWKFRKDFIFKVSSIILFIYVFFGLTISLYFFALDGVRLERNSNKFLEPRSKIDLFLSVDQERYVKRMISLRSSMQDEEKVLILSDNNPGLSYIIGMPSHTSFLFPPFMAYNKTMQEQLLKEIEINNFKYIIIPKTKEEFVYVDRINDLRVFISDYLEKSYILQESDNLFEIFVNKK